MITKGTRLASRNKEEYQRSQRKTFSKRKEGKRRETARRRGGECRRFENESKEGKGLLPPLDTKRKEIRRRRRREK